MKKIFFVLLLVFFTYNVFSFNISVDGKPCCNIVLSENSTKAEQYSCDILTKYLKQITGCDFNVSSNPISKNNIFIGKSASEKIIPDYNWTKLTPDSILIKFIDNNLILAGGEGSGTIYLDEYCGVMFVKYEEYFVPQKPTLSVDPRDQEWTSPFYVMRHSFFTQNNLYWEHSLAIKGNGTTPPIPEEYGGYVDILGFCHTFWDLINPSVYFKDHPEYFSEIDGKRSDGYVQLCLSNPEVVKLLTQNVLNRIASKPDKKIVSVSQNDSWGEDKTSCQCAKCKELNEKYGKSGTLILAINEVAKAVREKYPDKYVETLAYQYSRPAPKGGVVPEDNVIITLCSIDINGLYAIDEKTNESFMKDLQDWSKICKHLRIWDYVVNFGDYSTLRPNFENLQKNAQLYRDNNVVGVFSQGCSGNFNGPLEYYKQYIIAKLLWNPDIDFEKETKDFMDAYYGPAGEDMYNLVDYINSIMIKNHKDCPDWSSDNWIKIFKIFLDLSELV